ncbi:MAG: ribonuclease [Xanthobacteraceae bacterium]|nr:ribonuclease [Xanthobacteraceae bacterium]
MFRQVIRLVCRGAAQIVFVAALILVVVGALTTVLTPALAQDRRQNTAGAFDFYVLALSWSPSFCAASQERNPDRAPQQPQCGDRPFSFVVHGLWPQYEKGFPEYCQQPSPRLDRNIVSSMLDVMPSPRLVFHEWDRHGTCSGLSPRAYFEMVRKVRAAVKIPVEYLELKEPLMVSPAEVETAFVKANPGLTEGGIAVACDNKRLTEVRICVNRDLQFRSCDETDRRACRRDRLVMPPVRGG